LFESAPALCLVLAPDFTIVAVSNAYLEATGTSREEIVDRKLFDVWRDHPGAADLSASLERVLAEGVPHAISVQKYDIRRAKMAGSGCDERYWSVVNSPVLGAGDEVTHVIHRVEDVTEKKQSEARLLRSDRMASMGTLAASVAHEISSPLASLTANLEMMAETIGTLGDGSSSGPMTELETMTREARQAADRVRTIVRGLKTFSRADQDRPVALNVHPVLDLAISLVTNEIRHRAQLVKDYASVPLVDADEARLGQLFINLLLTAAQAIPPGQPDRNAIRVATRVDASGRAVVEVRDTGKAGPPDLSICRSIVASLGAEITVESDGGIGSVIRAAFPAGRLAPSKEQTSSSIPAPTPSRRGQVLVIDDDMGVGTALRLMLGVDHEVTVLTDGTEALRRLTSGERFDVILCDLMMPDITGMDLHVRLKEIAPDQARRMMFITGGAFSPAAEKFLAQVPNQRLEKPFDVKKLRAAVRGFIR
jgi:PAS domain S-box-containing protein